MSQVFGQPIADSGASAQQPPSASTELDNLLARYPAGSIHTTEDANRAGDDVRKMHALIDTQFTEEQKACYSKFFATACLNDAKERHRIAVARIRSIEIEVNKFKRLANVQAREKALAARKEREAAESVSRADETHPSMAASAPPLRTASSPVLQDQSNGESRIAKHQREVRKKQAAEAEMAKQREKNIAAYEKKRKESEARQQAIAAKKLEKERAQKAKSASASK